MKNVMIVEDQKMIRSILEGYIDKAADFLLAASVEGAERACEICETKKIHLVLMDVQTAHRENGLAAVKKIISWNICFNPGADSMQNVIFL